MSLGRLRKRSKAAESAATSPSEPDGEDNELIELRRQVEALQIERRALLSPINSSAIYDMMVKGEKERLGRDLWIRGFGADLLALRAANPEFVAMLEAQIANTSPVTEKSILSNERLIDGMLLDATRAQNMFKIPLVTAAVSVMGEANKVAREYHDALSTFHMGAATSENWVTDFLPIAMAQRPDPDWEPIVDVAVVCFDNLSMQIDYKSYSSEGETGRKLDMTTWFSTRLPRYLAPTLNAAAACALLSSPLELGRVGCGRPAMLLTDLVSHCATVRAGVFRTDLSLRAFGRLFYLNSRDITANRPRAMGPLPP